MRKTLISIIVAVVVLGGGAAYWALRSSTTPAKGGDVTLPKVAITSPSDQAEATGTVTVSVSASDNTGVQKVEYYLDNAFAGVSYAPPYSLKLDTSKLNAGAHELQAKAYDKAGNTQLSSSVIIMVGIASPVASAAPTPTPSATPEPVSGSSSGSSGKVAATPKPTVAPISTSAPTPTPTSTPNPGGDTTAPTMPTGLSLSENSSNDVDLTWSASTDNVGVTGYEVWRDGSLLASPATASYTDTTVATGTTYSYKVRARDAAGNWSAFTADIPITTALQSLNCAPVGLDTLNNTTSHLCGFPDTTNTGIPSGTTLLRVPEDVTSGDGWHWDSRGWVVIDGDGAVFSGYSVAATVDVDGSNETVENCRVSYVGGGGDSFGIEIRHAVNATVQHCDISGPNPIGGQDDDRMTAGIKDIYGDSTGTRVLANNIYDVSCGIQMDSGFIADNYVHNMGQNVTDHVDAVLSGGGGIEPMTVQHNTLLNQLDQTAAVALYEDGGGYQHDKLVTNNLMGGGGYVVYGGDQDHGGSIPTNMVFSNNHFSRIFYPLGGQFGSAAYLNTDASQGNFWTNNIWDDTGLVASP